MKAKINEVKGECSIQNTTRQGSIQVGLADLNES
jgi:hypothetical protein